MSAREWKPGDVAHFKSLRGDFDGIVFRFRPFGEDDDEWISATEGCAYPANGEELRPLMVIDPEDREQVERLWQAWRDSAPDHRLAQDNMQAALREFANPTPPKPPEPLTVGAVVEDRDGIRWTRTLRADVEFTTPWRDWNDDHFARAYDDITAVRVLSEGVQ